jgi:hypothetical protein
MSDVSLDMSSIRPNGTLLAIYSLPDEEREIMGYSRDCGVALYDRPAGGVGKGLYIDGGIHWIEALKGIVAEYVAHAERIGCPPVSKEGSSVAVASLDSGEAGVILGALFGLEGPCS